MLRAVLRGDAPQARPLALRFGRAAAAGGGRAAGGFVIEAAAVQKGGKVAKDYVSFTVLCTPAAAGAPWRLQKRFSDFEALRVALAAAVLPPAPSTP